MRTAFFALLLLASVSAAMAQNAEPLRVKENLWQEREAQRIANQRRDCEAQWAGIEKTRQARGQTREGFVEDCVAEARIARCHPPGSNPTCLYLSRQRRESEGRAQE